MDIITDVGTVVLTRAQTPAQTLAWTSAQTLALFHQTRYRPYELRYRSWHGCIDTDIDFGVDPGTDLSTILSTPAPT